MKMHYRGEAKFLTSEGYVRTMLAGWAICCSGDRAFSVRALGNHTYDRSKVTCKVCLQNLAKHDAYAAKKAREPLPPDVLADALQDRVHEDMDASRPACSVRAVVNGSSEPAHD